MTLKEHLEAIGIELSKQGANKLEILYLQLYILSLAWDGFSNSDIIREVFKQSEPYRMLDNTISKLWNKATEQYDKEGERALDSLLNDENLRRNTPREDYRDMFNALINRAARTGDYNYDHFQPIELSQLVYYLSGYKKGMSVYNPFAGVGSYADTFEIGDNYFGEEIDPIVWGIGVLRCNIYDCLSVNYICEDSTKRIFNRTFDIVVSTTPSGVNNSEEELIVQLINDASKLLNEGGTMILVLNSRLISKEIIRNTIVNSGLLDSVVILSHNVFYRTSYAPVIVRLKSDRDKKSPVLMVDGSSFVLPGGGDMLLVSVDEVLNVIEGKDDEFTKDVPTDVIRRKNCALDLSYFVERDKVPLGHLGTIIYPTPLKERPLKIIQNRNLSDNPYNLKVTPVDNFEKGITKKLGSVPQNALLIGGTPYHMRFGLLSDEIVAPIGVSNSILAFIPDEKLVKKEYVAIVFSQKKVTAFGSSAMRISKEQLRGALIPLVPLEEQDKIIRAYCKKEQNKVLKRIARVATVCNPIVPEEFKKELDEHPFDKIADVNNWLDNADNLNKIDAIIINQSDDVSSNDILILCLKKKPIFIITEDSQALEDKLGVYYEQFLKGRCFNKGRETDLLDSLFSYIGEQNSPEGIIRNTYSRQLKAAANLDGKFRFKDFCLRDKLEEILLNRNAGKDYRNEIRKIRDNCLLDPLVEYGFLPEYNTRDFSSGALICFLEDRYYKNGWILLKEIISKHLAKLLRATIPFLNDGSHNLITFDLFIQNIVIDIYMAFVCEISDLIDQGLFDKLNNDEINKNRKKYLGRMDDYQFTEGNYEVCCLKEDRDYLYANNVHLDRNVCNEKQIHTGDWVHIYRVDSEKQPKIYDYERIFFFSKSFDKVE